MLNMFLRSNIEYKIDSETDQDKIDYTLSEVCLYKHAFC